MADLSQEDLEVTGPQSGVISDGEYQVTFVSDEVYENGPKKKLTLAFNVDAGSYAGRRIWIDFWLRHTNPAAKNMSAKQLKDLFGAFGMDLSQVSDTSVAHGMSFLLTVKVHNEKWHNFVSARALGDDGIPF